MEPKQKLSISINGADQRRQHYLGRLCVTEIPTAASGGGGASLLAQLVKNPPTMKETKFNPWVRKIPWRRRWQPTPGFLSADPMDREAWQDTVQGVARVRYDLVTKPPPWQHLEKFAEVGKYGKEKMHSGVLGSGMTMANLGISERQHCIFKAFKV